ncbi:hypothetical protein BC829DRAFT_254236 [Chytridium lagenaria]|nr:hypothetical protein BC829DRAFT_254236 [Chytridium lagenaria]
MQKEAAQSRLETIKHHCNHPISSSIITIRMKIRSSHSSSSSESKSKRFTPTSVKPPGADAKQKGDSIRSFRGHSSFLSNFHPCDIEAQKVSLVSPNADTIKKTFSTMTPQQAKRNGRKVPLRDDWDSVKIEVMKRLVEIKFERGSELAMLLMGTGDMELVEGNVWNDTFWGVSLKSGKGENHLGKILMNRRRELFNMDMAHTQAGDQEVTIES